MNKDDINPAILFKKSGKIQKISSALNANKNLAPNATIAMANQKNETKNATALID